MKNIILAAAIVSLATLSCKKQHTCECVTQQNVMGMQQNVTSYPKTEKMTKAEAEKDCAGRSVSQNTGFSNQSVSCKLKN